MTAMLGRKEAARGSKVGEAGGGEETMSARWPEKGGEGKEDAGEMKKGGGDARSRRRKSAGGMVMWRGKLKRKGC